MQADMLRTVGIRSYTLVTIPSALNGVCMSVLRQTLEGTPLFLRGMVIQQR